MAEVLSYTVPESLDEEALEAAYWRFLGMNQDKPGTTHRDAFKYVVREFARKELRRHAAMKKESGERECDGV